MTVSASSLPRGAYAALATPVCAGGALDVDGLEHLVRHVVAGGAVGISPAGSTGEGARLTPAQRVEVTAQVRRFAPAGMPLIAGAPVRDAVEGTAQLEALADAGADAALVSIQVPYPLEERDVADVYEHLAGTARIPMVLYHIPAYTGIRLAVELVARLAAHPNVAGIKDSSRDMEYLQQVLAATADRDFRVFTGTDTLLLASLAMGVHGTIAASANLVPELAAGICAAFDAGDLLQARALQARLARIVFACRRGAAPAGWKAALSLRGICGPDLVPPGSALSGSLLDRLRADLAAEPAEATAGGRGA